MSDGTGTLVDMSDGTGTLVDMSDGTGTLVDMSDSCLSSSLQYTLLRLLCKCTKGLRLLVRHLRNTNNESSFLRFQSQPDIYWKTAIICTYRCFLAMNSHNIGLWVLVGDFNLKLLQSAV